jgi:single-strand DNA-binding protein
VNKLIIIGNLVRDPESRSLPTGVNLCTFTVAVNGRKEDDVQFFRVTTWRQLAENCQRFLAKGRKVAVTGAVSLNTYTAKDGTTKASLEVNADEVEFLGGNRSDADDTGLKVPQGFTPVDPGSDLSF